MLVGTAAALLAIPTLALGRVTKTVTVGPPGATHTFAPRTVTQTVGAGSIHWEWWRTAGSSPAAHNVRQDDKLFYSGEPTTDNPGGYTIAPSAGSFHYYCEPHYRRGLGGMDGIIYIRPAVFRKAASAFGVRWSPGTNETGNRFDVRYRVDGGAWNTWKNHVAAAQGLFGVSDNPVHVSPGHTYEVQARSEMSTDLRKRSSWSPSARVTTAQQGQPPRLMFETSDDRGRDRQTRRRSGGKSPPHLVGKVRFAYQADSGAWTDPVELVGKKSGADFSTATSLGQAAFARFEFTAHDGAVSGA